MLTAAGVHKTYQRRSGRVQALVDVHLSVAQGSTVLLAGPSGSGKSTLARCFSGHDVPDAGGIELDGKPLDRERRPEIQLVFQDAAMSFNPWMNVEAIVTEALRIRGVPAAQRRLRCEELLSKVNVPTSTMTRFAFELSGGERNRVSIARALAASPRVLILDEVSSGLDPITRHQLFDLLLSIQRVEHISLLLISHDLHLAAQVADVIGVMESGRIVERGEARDVLAKPQHACTRALIEALDPLRPQA
jgi:ABC-type dipeptide/oligopeptide/nickel transport system ATPase subunit